MGHSDFRTELLSIQLIGIYWLAIGVIAVSCQRHQEKEPERREFRPQNNSRAVESLSPELIYEYDLFYLPRGQSDWELLYRFDKQRLLKVRLGGFQKYNHGESIEIEIEDSDTLKLIDSKFVDNKSFRPLISDLSMIFGGAGGGGAIGFIELWFGMDDEDRVLVGVTEYGYVLGELEGASRQVFFNPSLTIALESTLKKFAQISIDDKAVEALSGKCYFD